MSIKTTFKIEKEGETFRVSDKMRVEAFELFYSYEGYDVKGEKISCGNGFISLLDAKQDGVQERILKIAKSYNGCVHTVNLIALTPMSFREVEEYE